MAGVTHRRPERSVPQVVFGQRYPDALRIFMAIESGQRLTFAGAGHALAILDQKQRTVGGALDQAGAAVQKLVGLPFQRDAAMRAAIPVDENLALSAYRQKPVVYQLEPPAL